MIAQKREAVKIFYEIPVCPSVFYPTTQKRCHFERSRGIFAVTQVRRSFGCSFASAQDDTGFTELPGNAEMDCENSKTVL